MEIDTIYDIDARGDVILAVGLIQDDVTEDYTRPVQRLRVSSAVLRLASAVFAVLLEAQREERRTNPSTSQVEIALPEDDAQAMLSLCQMLHFQHNQLSPTAEELLEIAKLSDKYDCTDAIVPMADCWLNHFYKESSKLKRKRQLLVAAFLFRRPAFFARIGRELLLRAKSKDAFSVPTTCEGQHKEQLINVFGALIDARASAIFDINCFVERELLDATDSDKSGPPCYPSCKYRDAYWADFLESIRMAKVWPGLAMEGSSLSNNFSRLRNVEWRVPKGGSNRRASCGIHCFLRHDDVAGAEELKARFESKAWEAEGSLPELCLECARAGFALKQKDCVH